MKKQLFDELCQSIREMGAIRRGELEPGRVTTVGAPATQHARVRRTTPRARQPARRAVVSPDDPIPDAPACVLHISANPAARAALAQLGTQVVHVALRGRSVPGTTTSTLIIDDVKTRKVWTLPSQSSASSGSAQSVALTDAAVPGRNRGLAR